MMFYHFLRIILKWCREHIIKILNILKDDQRRVALLVEMTITIDAGKAFVQSTYSSL